MKLYRHYRHKKFEEPLEMENEQVDNLDDSFEKLMRMADEQEKKMEDNKKRLAKAFDEPAEISDLDTVNEEEDDAYDQQEVEFTTKQEALDNIQEDVLASVISSMVRDHALKVAKVKQFLQVCVQHYKFRKMSQAVRNI